MTYKLTVGTAGSQLERFTSTVRDDLHNFGVESYAQPLSTKGIQTGEIVLRCSDGMSITILHTISEVLRRHEIQ